MDSIADKLRDLQHDIGRRDAVAFRMHLHELARRGLYNAELDAMTRDEWSTGFGDDMWNLVAAQLAAATQIYECDVRSR